jgi:hypothetical protein
LLHDLSKLRITIDKTLKYEVAYYPTHPKAASRAGMVYIHRIIMENYLNRYLEDYEHVHHIDEDRSNNKLENLEILTNSEHAKLHHPITLEQRICINCGKLFQPINERMKFCCRECNAIDKAKNIPLKEDLEKIIWTMPTTKIAEFYNVSDVAIAKWCKKYNIEKPPRGYWTKQKSNLKER